MPNATTQTAAGPARVLVPSADKAKSAAAAAAAATASPAAATPQKPTFAAIAASAASIPTPLPAPTAATASAHHSTPTKEASHLRPPPLPRARTISGASAHSNHSHRSYHSSYSSAAQHPPTTPTRRQMGRRLSHSHSHTHSSHCDHTEDGYNTDDSSSTVSTLTFELSNTYILPEPFLVFCPFACDDQTPYASVHPLLDHLLSAHGIKIANVGVVAGVMTTYLDEWARRVQSNADLKKPLDEFAKDLKAALDTVENEPVATPADATATPAPAQTYAAVAATAASLLTSQLNQQLQQEHQHRPIALTLGDDEDEWDRTLRASLTKAKLTEVLKIQDKERHTEAHLPRKCLFCKTVADNRASLFRHMFTVHSFNIGLPDNLVYVSHFLDLLSDKLARLQCLYCERTFKSSAVLRKHMRKKRHFRISPRNHEYDRFYVVNYLEPGKNWETLTNAEKYFESDEDDRADRKSVYSNAMTGTSLPPPGAGTMSIRSHSYMTSVVGDGDELGNDDTRWSDWEEDDAETGANMRETCPCLFCPEALKDGAEACVAHMADVHAFDLKAITKAWGLSLYQTLVLINFLRKASLAPHCPLPGCSSAASMSDLADLSTHLATAGCLAKLPKPAHATGVHVSLATGAHEAKIGDEETLRAVAAELRGGPAAMAVMAAASEPEMAGELPAQWDKVGDTVVVLDGMSEGDLFWDDPQYLFPALDGDPLLAYAVDVDEDDEWDAEPEFMH
ncbi:C2H2 type zinc-finger-domain-containing protein, partial [Catenaria anguillulae PL171]